MRLLAIAAVSLLAAAAACSAPPDGGGEPPPDPANPTSGTPIGTPPPSDDAGAPSPTTDAGVTPGPSHDAGTDSGHDAGHDSGPPNPCPALVFPSGVKIQTFLDPVTTATYTHHLASGQTAPKCFLDTTNLEDPDTGKIYDLSVDVAAHFQMTELVGTEIAQGYGHHVLLAPSAVASLEKFRDSVGVSVGVNSGFRSPLHQEAVCKSLCGDPLGCPGTCANSSRHMWGDAFDLPLAFYTAHDEDVACTSGFKFAYLESGTHLHIDQNPAYATCVKQ